MLRKRSREIVGGGPKKVLYTLGTLSRIGLKNSATALRAKNACKACGLGMGGQNGGMTNELGEFPAVCNKSVQAQSTDIQSPIPLELFERHKLADFQELSGYEIEHLGRLGVPIYKAPGEDSFQAIDWDQAIDIAAGALSKTQPDRTFFYASGRSSNEAAFVLQLFARLYGTNNVNNCSYYCHQATGVALDNSVGTGTATVQLADLDKCDLLFLIGANPASNHPRLVHKLKALRERGGQVIVINPAREPGLIRFAVPKSARSMLSGGSEIASEYLQPRVGTDIVLLKGIAKAVLEAGSEDGQFADQYCTGFSDFSADVKSITWDQIVAECGVSRSDIERVAQLYSRANNAVFAWGMGVTHHQHGVENIEYISNLALLRGMVGREGAGLLPLRGHSNVQGVGTVGVKPELPKSIAQQIESTLNVALPTTKGMDTLAGLEAAARGDIDVAVMMGGNLLAASPDRQWCEQVMSNIGTRIFLTTTLNHGHVYGVDGGASLVLPVTARDEEWQPTTQESMFNFVRFSEGGISRLSDVLPETEVLVRIAQQLLSDSSVDFSRFREHAQLRKLIAEIVPGMGQLADIDEKRAEFHIPGRILHAPEFTTDDGKARFITHASVNNAASSDYPFSLMTVRSEGQFNTIIYEENDSYRGVDDRWTVLMNELDMQQLGVKAGERVTLTSKAGRMEQVAVAPFDLPQGDLMAYFPEANVLIGRERDPRSLTPAFKSVPVAVSLAV